MDELSDFYEIPRKFIDLIKIDENMIVYSDLMLKIMASDLRCLIVTLGEAVVEKIINGILEPNKNVKNILRRLVNYYYDPIKNENNIFEIQKMIRLQCEITRKNDGE